MKYYKIATWIVFILILLLVFWFIIKLCQRNRKERIEFVLEFKKGKCFLLYIWIFPVLYIGHVFQKGFNLENAISSIFSAVSETMELVVLKYKTGNISNLMDAYLGYKVVIYISFLLVMLNVILFAASIFGQFVWQQIQKWKFYFNKSDELIIFGKHPNNLLIYQSETNRKKYIIDSFSSEERAKFYLENISYVKYQQEEQIKNIEKKINEHQQYVDIIINFDSEEMNTNLCASFIKNMIEKYSNQEGKEAYEVLNRLSIYVFGLPEFQAIYEKIMEKGRGCIHYVNKYDCIARGLIEKYPFTLFMSEEQIDYQRSTIYSDVNINCFMIGFGKTGQQIFLNSVANHTFIEERDGKIQLKPVQYYIYDRQELEKKKNLNHNYYRYKNEVLVNKDHYDQYLPLPDYPAHEEYYHMDIDDPSFYRHLQEQMTKSPKDIHFIMITFGSDLSNIDLAQKLAIKVEEWNVKNVHIFVKVRKLNEIIHELVLDDKYILFGNEQEDVYNIEKIKGGITNEMAQYRDIIYQMTKNNESYDEVLKRYKQKCNVNQCQIEKESNRYALLSMRSKLHMMGLDYEKKNQDNRDALSFEEYLSIYLGGSSFPDLEIENETRIKEPKLLNIPDSRRKTFAILEHYRWNAYQISRGIIPSTKKQILEEKTSSGSFTNGKNYHLRRHGNLTDFDGLVTFREMIAERDYKLDPSKTKEQYEKDRDVIKYDFQILDDAYWIMEHCEYKIIHKK